MLYRTAQHLLWFPGAGYAIRVGNVVHYQVYYIKIYYTIRQLSGAINTAQYFSKAPYCSTCVAAIPGWPGLALTPGGKLRARFTLKGTQFSGF